MEIGVTDDPENVGFYSGLVESIFAVVQLFTSRTDSSTSIQPFNDLSFQSCLQVLFLTGGEGNLSYSLELLEWP